MFYVGQKVVCIDNTPQPNSLDFGDGERPLVGNIYTITFIFKDIATGSNVLCFHLAEIRRDNLSREMWDNEDIGYGAFRFKPLIEKKTDISIFKALINPVNHKELV